MTKLKSTEYVKTLRLLQAELCKLQDWVKRTGYRAIVVFEGRDTAGKGGAIRATTERVSPRVFRVVALPAPSDREKTARLDVERLARDAQDSPAVDASIDPNQRRSAVPTATAASDRSRVTGSLLPTALSRGRQAGVRARQPATAPPRRASRICGDATERP